MSLDVSLHKNEKCPHCGGTVVTDKEVYEANITHNLTLMADEAGIYKHLWRPEEIGITKASELIDPLRKGLELMRSDPPRFKKYNASNGWGLYEQLERCVENYLAACIANPEATIRVSR